MDGQTGERAHRQGWAVVAAWFIGSVSRFYSLTRPVSLLALAVCLAALALVHGWVRLPIAVVRFEVFAVPLALPRLHKILVELSLVWCLLSIVVGWWLPRGQSCALAALVAVVGMATPLVLADPLMAICGVLLAVGGLALVLAQGEGDGGVPLLVGSATIGVLCLAASFVTVHPSAHPTHLAPATWWRWAVMGGLALLLGLAPAPLWLPGASEKGHPLGVVLAAAVCPALVCVLVLPMGKDATLVPQAQAMVMSGVGTVVIASFLALGQTDVRRMAGFLLAADLGCTVAVLGTDVQAMGPEMAFVGVSLQLLTRGLAVPVIVFCLAFLSSGLRPGLRLPLVVLLGLALCLLAGGPLTPSYPWRWETVGEIWHSDRLAGAALGVGGFLGGVAALVLLVRAGLAPVADGQRPLPRLALMLVAVPIVVSLILWRHPDWLAAHFLTLLVVP